VTRALLLALVLYGLAAAQAHAADPVIVNGEGRTIRFDVDGHRRVSATLTVTDPPAPIAVEDGSVELTAADLAGRRLVLDLGTVDGVAEVTVNGIPQRIVRADLGREE
jgi:hypothetical protein